MSVGDFVLVMGQQQIFINPKDIKGKTAMELAARVSKVRAKHSPLNIVEKLEGETSEEWFARYLEHLGQDSTRRPGESNQEFLDRTFKPVAVKDNLEQIFDYVCEIADLFGQRDRCDLNLMLEQPIDAPYEFVIKVLKKCRIPTADLEG